MTQAYTRPGSTDVDYNAVTGDSVTGAAQKLDNAIDDIYGQVQDGSTLVKGVLQLGTTATTAALGNHLHTGTYAPAAEGVTNGNSHDHSGGDGAQIAYSTLSGLPTLGTAAAQDTTAFQAADVNTLKSNVFRVRTKSHPGTKVAVTANTLTLDLEAGEVIDWTPTGSAQLNAPTISGAGVWAVRYNYTSGPTLPKATYDGSAWAATGDILLIIGFATGDYELVWLNKA